jgi:hypothetical protein
MAPVAEISRRRRSAGTTALCAGAVAVGMVATGQMHEAFTTPAVSARSQGRKAVTAMRGEAFDPFGWKGAFKDVVATITGEVEPDVPPTKLEEAMILEIFSKFDEDGDKVLNLEEFNTLQVATEGNDAVYNMDQLKDLLRAVNSDIKEPEKGMPFEDYRRLYVTGRLKRAYSTDVGRDHVKIFGPGGGVAADPSKYEEDDADSEYEFIAGKNVIIDGLSGAKELNGRAGVIAAPVDSEKDMVGEGRVIVQLSDGERIALKPANVKAV